MAEPRQAEEAAGSLGASKATETLSQFVARVLNQLSLSAWLPSAAIVLSLTFVFQLGAVIEAEPKPTSPGAAVNATISAIAQTSLGGALLLIAAVVVLTMLTQAFAFESIRVLEGYWGTSRFAEWLADRRCRHHEGEGVELRIRYAHLTGVAWRSARAEIEKSQGEAIEKHQADAEVRTWTPDMLTYLGAKLLEQDTDVRLAPGERIQALTIPWQGFAPSSVLRHQVNLDKRLRDYPKEGRTLPTRLGNVFRAYEDQTGRESVETLILEVYDQLPAALRHQHDEQRNRLDLYCSMVFVTIAVAGVSIARFFPHHWIVALASLVLGVIFAWVSYRAAIASAQVYGILLVSVAKRFPAPRSQPVG